jgi:hypothetical protein
MPTTAKKTTPAKKTAAKKPASEPVRRAPGPRKPAKKTPPADTGTSTKHIKFYDDPWARGERKARREGRNLQEVLRQKLAEYVEDEPASA